MSYAVDNAQTACAQVIKEADGEATYADRQAKIKELAVRLMQEFPDYRKSMVKHVPNKITLLGKQMSRAEIEAE